MFAPSVAFPSSNLMELAFPASRQIDPHSHNYETIIPLPSETVSSSSFSLPRAGCWLETVFFHRNGVNEFVGFGRRFMRMEWKNDR